jgi:adenine C2-methylase RlmN of 23S rRNA A2503 and tRNA A37
MTIESNKILSEISVGELLDKMSILEIKLEKIKNEESRKKIDQEYQMLKELQKSKIEMTNEIETLFKNIKKVNSNLWNIEDKIRICEKNKDFSQDFIELARSVYFNNDKRSKIKSKMNKISGSNIKEIKQYVNY